MKELELLRNSSWYIQQVDTMNGILLYNKFLETDLGKLKLGLENLIISYQLPKNFKNKDYWQKRIDSYISLEAKVNKILELDKVNFQKKINKIKKDLKTNDNLIL